MNSEVQEDPAPLWRRRRKSRKGRRRGFFRKIGRIGRKIGRFGKKVGSVLKKLPTSVRKILQKIPAKILKKFPCLPGIPGLPGRR